MSQLLSQQYSNVVKRPSKTSREISLMVFFYTSTLCKPLWSNAYGPKPYKNYKESSQEICFQTFGNASLTYSYLVSHTREIIYK